MTTNTQTQPARKFAFDNSGYDPLLNGEIK